MNTVTIGGDMKVSRIGYGPTRIVDQNGNFGQPADRKASLAVLRAVVDAGVTFIDTAKAYKPGVCEEVITELRA